MRLRHDLAHDRLRFELADGAGSASDASAVIDIGEGGRLLGIEIPGLNDPDGDGPYYLTVTPGSGGDHARSAAAMVTVERDESGAVRAVELPRHGAGYEISWPSGNR
ncbi:MAG: hypothetical protein ACR2J8_02905 [Thermomicrobiales bacterium]